VGYEQVNLWRPGVEAPLRTLSAHSGFVRAVTWSPDGTSIASAGQDGSVRIWNADTLQQTTMIDTAAPARALKGSPDGSRLAVGGESGRLQIWRAAGPERVHSAWTGATISSVSWSPDGRRLAVGGINGKASVWNATTGALLIILRVSDLARNDVNGLTWSPHGRLLASAQGARGAGDIRLWDPDGGKVVQTLTGGGGGWLRAVGWSPDGQWIAAGGEEGDVRIWNVETGEVAATRRIGPQPVWSVAWSPDGRLLAAGTGAFDSRSVPGTLTVWAAPVTVLPAGRASAHAQVVEAALIERGKNVAKPTPRPALPATVFKDAAAYGMVPGLDPPFGNLETSFIESDIRALGIAAGDTFHLQCREKTFGVLLGTTWSDVARGEWAAFFSLEGTLIIARNTASAVEASGCAAGSRVFVSKRPE
jgi:dipeptidyl aminopeptidase/acylaminoacyl peptidase